MENSPSQPIWDMVVRLTHWGVAGLFFANFFFTEEGSDIHEWVGYSLVALVVVRLCWGLITDSPARLSRFFPSVTAAIEHLKEVKQTKQDTHQGHNPAGALMVWFIWLNLLLISLSGWAMGTDAFWGEDWVKEVHEFFVNLTMLAVCGHVFAVFAMTKITKNNYLKGIIKGHR
ncbi:cytochrome b/b6 domain-containing protein [Motilimonas sp. E26]|uniref:cytochrome b/b6 domain-containing protein n=1 Tax=Motilimonas sp. E26 TaxID=2865674 RepID=UPI001E4EE1EC|nr:cytochrome b/b6 domain-containing protein [Motilimonas sp. E26]MCE0558969.1 cytochrome b/b6 domain-containing protein [Motilimonas sp. E26]